MLRKLGKAITAGEHEDAMQLMDVYEQWFLKEVMQVEKFNSFLMSQSEDVKPMCRDDLPPLVSLLQISPALTDRQRLLYIASMAPLVVSSILGAPELVLPCMQL